VDVKVVRQARPGASAEVHPHVKAVRLNGQAKGLLAFYYQFGQLKKLLVVGLLKLGNMPDRCYQEVTVVIGKTVQYYDALAGPPQDHSISIVLRGL
jgi:hypothetical protein